LVSFHNKEGNQPDDEDAIKFAQQTNDFFMWVRSTFVDADVNFDGMLDIAEFKNSFSTEEAKAEMRKIDLDQLDVGLLFKELDKDKDKSLSVDEIMAGFVRMREMQRGMGHILSVFQKIFELHGTLAKDGSRQMTIAQFIKAFSKRGVIMILCECGVYWESILELFDGVKDTGREVISMPEAVCVFLSRWDMDKIKDHTLNFIKQIFLERFEDPVNRFLENGGSMGNYKIHNHDLKKFLSDRELWRQVNKQNSKLPTFAAMITDLELAGGYVKFSDMMDYFEKCLDVPTYTFGGSIKAKKTGSQDLAMRPKIGFRQK